MPSSVCIVSFLLATVLGYGYFSESSIWQGDTGRKVQIVLSVLCLMLVVYVLIAASFVSALLTVGIEAAGVFVGKVVAEMLARS
ncbi:MAG: hypothetical protein O7C39_04315 [Bacteroidetes bacterium]|nr:hypothetical protein [Bacteroidota bacterium]